MNTIIPHSLRFTQKTGTCELCPRHCVPTEISTAIRDGTETRPKGGGGGGSSVGLPGGASIFTRFGTCFYPCPPTFAADRGA